MSAFDANVDLQVDIAVDGSGPFDSSPTWTDVSGWLRSAEWTRGRPPSQGEFPAGSGRVVFDNVDGRFYPWDSTGPYYPNLDVGVPIRIRAVHSSTTYPLFYGYLGRATTRYPTNRDEVAEFPMVESATRLVRDTIIATDSEERSDVRIGNLLDQAGWPAGRRDLDSGLVFVAATDSREASVWYQLQDTAFAEGGHLFQDAAGDIAFRNRAAVSGATPVATFGPSASDLVYQDVTVTRDDRSLFNRARIAAAVGDPQLVEDTTSIDKHGPVLYERVSPSLRNESDAEGIAEWVIAVRSQIDDRIVGFDLDPAEDPANLWPHALGLDLRDVIRVKADYPGAGVTLDQTVAVDQVTHRIEVAGTWRVSYGCWPLSTIETQDYWTIGVSALGTETRLI